MQVVVYTEKRHLGRARLDQIFDNRRGGLPAEHACHGHGIRVSRDPGAVIDVIDVRGVLDRAVPGLMTASTTTTTTAATLAIDVTAA